jgi:hypothetical protein
METTTQYDVNFSRVIASLRSADPEVLASGIADAVVAVEELSKEVVHAFVTSRARFPIAERIIQMGSCLRVTLEDEFDRRSDPEEKSWIGLVLLKIGSAVAVDHLLVELRSQSSSAVMIAIALSQAGVIEAKAPIESILRTWDLRVDPYTVASLVEAIGRLGGTFPADIRHRIENEAQSPYREAILKLVDSQGLPLRKP